MVIQKRKRLQHTVTKTQTLTTENVKTHKCLKDKMAMQKRL